MTVAHAHFRKLIPWHARSALTREPTPCAHRRPAALLPNESVPVLIAAAELLHRGVELPGIELGVRIARWLNRSSVPDRRLSESPVAGDVIIPAVAAVYSPVKIH